MESSHELGPIQVKPRRGDERFRDGGEDLPFELADFWRWSCSDLVSNATRGVLAEYLVARALGVVDGVRDEWAAWDLTATDGTRIEVKSAAYIQSWGQKRLTPISFRVAKTLAWDRESARFGVERKRHADLYVFALLAHRHQPTLDPLDVSQWEFYVLPTATLDDRTRSQDSITLRSLRALAGPAVAYSGLRGAIEVAGRRRRKSAAPEEHHRGSAT